VSTYVQRDVRQIVNVGDLESFAGFLRLSAGRTAQELNLSALGGDAGISHNTARAWLSVLEASFVLHRLPTWHANLRKQAVKAPKLHFFDSGVACHLLGIREAEQLRLHPLRGAVFESWVVAEVYKGLANRGVSPRLYHYRETRGVELDLLIEDALALEAVEIKSGATVGSDFFRNLARFSEQIAAATGPQRVRSTVLFGGEHSQQRSQARVLSWREVGRLVDD
jgi:predicted AAA+ superfamily ATPase